MPLSSVPTGHRHVTASASIAAEAVFGFAVSSWHRGPIAGFIFRHRAILQGGF